MVLAAVPHTKRASRSQASMNCRRATGKGLVFGKDWMERREGGQTSCRDGEEDDGG